MNIVIPSLILLVSSVILTCIVVNYAISVFQSYLGDIPDFKRLEKETEEIKQDAYRQLQNATETETEP